MNGNANGDTIKMLIFLISVETSEYNKSFVVTQTPRPETRNHRPESWENNWTNVKCEIILIRHLTQIEIQNNIGYIVVQIKPNKVDFCGLVFYSHIYSLTVQLKLCKTIAHLHLHSWTHTQLETIFLLN